MLCRQQQMEILETCTMTDKPLHGPEIDDSYDIMWSAVSPAPAGNRGELRPASFGRLAITQNGEAGSNEPTRRAYDPATSALFNCDNEPIPTLDDVAGWGTSFENLMKCAAGRVLFREFLRFEYSEENVLFWAACEELKREVSPEAVEERARAIYEEYISVLSPKEVLAGSDVI
ncbi:regulator of G-protein signaling 20-like [Ctenocephalides felis]|uniref:regulator of G-protein signaling 20-like n=1 Tax=Ctenocephalides felis TaxID=7515 RepID=UPI000E6E2101|nr:regulator of G-protein signaling 20-like [Ctenocephalides felis]